MSNNYPSIKPCRILTKEEAMVIQHAKIEIERALHNIEVILISPEAENMKWILDDALMGLQTTANTISLRATKMRKSIREPVQVK